MKTLALILALTISGGLFAQSKPTYTQINSNTVKVTWYHDNGNIRETGFFTNDKKDGIWISFDENGKKLSEASFNKGEKDGNWTFWNEQGAVTFHMVYDNGKRLLATQWDENGKLIAGKQD